MMIYLTVFVKSPCSKILLYIFLLSYLHAISSGCESGERGCGNATVCNTKKTDSQLNKWCKLSEIARYACCPGQDLKCSSVNGSCDEFKSAGFSSCDPVYNSREVSRGSSKMKYECRKQNPYENVTIWNRKSRKNLTHLLGKPCNEALYKERMAPIWRRYLTCPHDYDYRGNNSVTKDDDYEHHFAVLKDDWHTNNEILNQVCFSSFMEGCYNGTCRCLHEIYKTHVDKSGKETGSTILNFTQRQEGHHCGIEAGGLCTHNRKEMKNYCKVAAEVGRLDPGTFTCEIDAMCELPDWDSKVCKLDETCKCVCAVGYSCYGNQATSQNLPENYFICITTILLIYCWNLYGFDIF